MIFYFSGTGNTLWAAKKLAAMTGDEMVFVPDVINEPYRLKLSPGERIGFCFPVHGWRPPLMIRRLIEQLVIENADNNYVYALVTAGDNIGETITILRNDLAKRGLELHSACSLVMPESYVGLPFMDVDTEQKEKAKINAAAKTLAWFADVVVNRTKREEKLVLGNWPRINSRLIGGFFYKYLITDKPFHVVEDRCLKCGKCASVCSVHNISFHHGNIPQWNHNGLCMTCFSCYHHCPTHAIEFGNRTKHKGQYFFKDVNEDR